MARYQSNGDFDEDIAHYQKKLIPLNIFVCILCIVSIVTMLFVPFLKVDISKILGHAEVKKFVSQTITDAMGGDNNASVHGDYILAAAQQEGDGSGSGSGSGDNNQQNDLTQ